MQGTVKAIYIVGEGGAPMLKLDQVKALADCGLEGDRYCKGAGYWTGVDECQATLIAAEDLEKIAGTTDVRIQNGEHRRNLITSGIRLDSLQGKKFQVGEAIFEYDRPRPPCVYIQKITQPGMTQALMGRGGICARVVRSGLIRVGDSIVVL